VPKWIDLIGIALADAVVDRAETRLMMTSEHGADVSGRARARKPPRVLIGSRLVWIERGRTTLDEA
jgi:hypothetical protein